MKNVSSPITPQALERHILSSLNNQQSEAATLCDDEGAHGVTAL